MEYLQVETLYDILQLLPLAVCEAVQLASRLCGILEYMHRHNVVHCDLNPSNIILSDDGSPHIIDFGIASAPGWFSPKAGTPEYMAPEQIRGDRLDSRADIYATGALLYELVTGTRPFLNAGQGSVPVLPRELNSDVSEQIEEIILHAMAPNPRDRYGSAAAMQAELDFPGTVQVTGIYKNPRKASAWPKRLRLAGVVLSLAAVPFILFYLFLLMFQRQLAR